MEKKYSVEEILDAINDLNNFKKNSIPKKTYNTTNSEDDDIPSNTLKLIEQAEGKN